MWSNKAHAVPPFPVLDADHFVDIAVIGGGIAGVSAAYALNRAGHTTIVVDAGNVGCGATGHSTGKPVRIHGVRASNIGRVSGFDHAAAYVYSNRSAQDAIREWIQVEEIDCGAEMRQHLVWATSDSGDTLLDDEYRLLSQLRESCVLRLPTADDNLPAHATSVLEVRDELMCDPTVFTRTLARALVARGGEVFERTQAVELEAPEPGMNGRSVVITANGSRISALHVVIASHVPVFDTNKTFAKLGYRRSTCLAFETGTEVPMATPVDDGGLSMRPERDQDGTMLAVFCGMGREMSSALEETAARTQLEERARGMYPSLGKVRYAWDTHDPFPHDFIPHIGKVDGDGSHFVITGMGGWGLTGGVVGALVISALITRRHNPWAEYLRLRSSKELARPSVNSQGLNNIREFVEERVEAVLPPDEPGDLEAGQGAVFDTEDGLVAAARDAHGDLHMVSAECTHKGCAVRFNSADETWDCDCHGSRFRIDGEVIEGPAVDALTVIHRSTTHYRHSI